MAYSSIDKSKLLAQLGVTIESNSVKSLIYGLWIDGNPVSIDALGVSMTGVPATTKMHFRIGGVNETIQTTMLMQLVERNKIKLNDPISPWFLTFPKADKITIKMLANSTSGIPDYVYNPKFLEIGDKDPFKKWTTGDLLDYAFLDDKKDFNFEPGTSQQYSHTNYVMLGHILEQVSKQKTNQLMKAFILDKLNMAETGFELTASMPQPVLHSFSEERKIYEDATFWDPSWTSYAGAVYSTIHDLGKWGNAWMEGTLISAASTEQLRAPDTAGKGNNTQENYFAMGFIVKNHWLIQNPAFGGYSGVIGVLPEKKIVFIAYNTMEKISDKENEISSKNQSVELFKEIVKKYAPEYPLLINSRH